VTRNEQGLGEYSLQGLKISVGDQSASVVPIARRVVEHLGDTDIRSSGRADITNGLQTYGLYRVRENGQDVWYVVNDDGKLTP